MTFIEMIERMAWYTRAGCLWKDPDFIMSLVLTDMEHINAGEAY